MRGDVDATLSRLTQLTNLTQGQKAIVAAALEPMYAEAAKQRQREHGGTAPGRPSETLVADPPQVNKAREQAATALEPMYAEAAKQRVGGRPRLGEENPVADLPQGSEREHKSVEQAAKAVGASGRGVSQAKAIQRDAPDLVDKVVNGEMSLDAADKERKKRTGSKKRIGTPTYVRERIALRQ